MPRDHPSRGGPLVEHAMAMHPLGGCNDMKEVLKRVLRKYVLSLSTSLVVLYIRTLPLCRGEST